MGLWVPQLTIYPGIQVYWSESILINLVQKTDTPIIMNAERGDKNALDFPGMSYAYA